MSSRRRFIPYRLKVSKTRMWKCWWESLRMPLRMMIVRMMRMKTVRVVKRKARTSYWECKEWNIISTIFQSSGLDLGPFSKLPKISRFSFHFQNVRLESRCRRHLLGFWRRSKNNSLNCQHDQHHSSHDHDHWSYIYNDPECHDHNLWPIRASLIPWCPTS